VGVLFFVFIKGVFNSGKEGWERSVGLRRSGLQGSMMELGLRLSLVRGKGEKGEGKKEGRGKKASDLVKLFARKKRKKRVAIS